MSFLMRQFSRRSSMRMKISPFSFLLAALIAIFLGASGIFNTVRVYAAPPQPVGYVNDFANIIPDDVEAALEAKLSAYETKTTNEVVVVTVLSLEGKSVEDYTIELARAWGVGQKEKDNGIVILVAPSERKVRIEVGYGLEGTIPDAIAKRIIEQDMTPKFRAGDLAAGIVAGVDAVLGRLEAADAPPPSEETSEETSGGGNAGLVVGIVFGSIAGGIVLILFFVWLLGTFRQWRAEVARRKRVRQETVENMVQLERDVESAFLELKKLKEDMQ